MCNGIKEGRRLQDGKTSSPYVLPSYLCVCMLGDVLGNSKTQVCVLLFFGENLVMCERVSF